MNKHKIPRVLVIAGSDSSGGAGIQADIKTLTVFKVYSMTAITAITAQNTNGVSSIESISLDTIKRQIEACISDIGVDAIKIGMVNKGEIFDLIFEVLNKYKISKKGIPIILDPVMFAKGGFPLLENQAISALKEFIDKVGCILTPNIPEAESLSGLKILNKNDMIKAIKIININGTSKILLKGGHLNEIDLCDILYDKNTFFEFYSKKINTTNTHGTGCTISSAITANLSKGLSLYDSVSIAHDYVNKSILKAPNLGSGHGPLNHFHAIPNKL